MQARSPAPPYRGEGPFALWHVSEDRGISRFEPRAHPERGPVVWAVDTRHLPMFWFPRDCPRATFWADERTTPDDRARFLPGAASRVHAIEGEWLERLRGARPIAYRLPEETFLPTGMGYWLSSAAVEPLEAVELGDLLARHADAAIELRIVPALLPLWEQVIASTLQYSGIRLRNARA